MNKCKVCGSDTEFKFEKAILNKYNIKYYKCSNCCFIQTEKPFWLDEAYSSAITKQDIGLLYRNLIFSPIVSNILHFFYNKNSFLDYGGGYGVFVRLMRDNGYDFYRYDTYCENVFAEGFDDKYDKYELITSFEVFEHIENPIEEIEKILKKSNSILFSTELQPKSSIEDWWYIMPETGQHISLYSYETLEYISKKYNLNLYSNGFNLHLITDKKINKYFFQLLCKVRVSKLIDLFISKKSLLMDDYKNLHN